MKTHSRPFARSMAWLGLLLGLSVSVWAAPTPKVPALWTLARQEQSWHRFSTLITAQDVRHYLSSDAGIQKAIDWCRHMGITKVYIEEFRDGYQAPRATLIRARDRFRAAGFAVSGCVTTTDVGKKSNHWKEIACYTDQPTQEHLQRIFEYAASMFNEIMIDDFWFTDCTCAACNAARLSRTVRIGNHTYHTAGDTWEDYRRELMLRLSEDRILAPAKRVNPEVKIIIKYPQWYDQYQDRGYDVIKETAAFDRIWVGTETRDYTDSHWGGTVQYEGYFIMRWLGGIGGEKCGGGWFDWLGTTPRTYIEQARQTVLGGARESMLFCFGGLHRQTGPEDAAALRTQIPELLRVAHQVRQRHIVGVAAYKPANSHPGSEARVFDFVGMLGLPLVPCHEFPTNAPAAFFSVHALKDAAFKSELGRFLKSGRPVLLTDGLARKLPAELTRPRPNLHILAVQGNPKRLLTLTEPGLNDLRAFLLKPLKTSFQAPNKVGLYLFRDGSWVVENFNDDPVSVRLNDKPITVAGRGWKYHWQ